MSMSDTAQNNINLPQLYAKPDALSESSESFRFTLDKGLLVIGSFHFSALTVYSVSVLFAETRCDFSSYPVEFIAFAVPYCTSSLQVKQYIIYSWLITLLLYLPYSLWTLALADSFSKQLTIVKNHCEIIWNDQAKEKEEFQSASLQELKHSFEQEAIKLNNKYEQALDQLAGQNNDDDFPDLTPDAEEEMEQLIYSAHVKKIDEMKKSFVQRREKNRQEFYLALSLAGVHIDSQDLEPTWCNFCLFKRYSVIYYLITLLDVIASSVTIFFLCTLVYYRNYFAHGNYSSVMMPDSVTDTENRTVANINLNISLPEFICQVKQLKFAINSSDSFQLQSSLVQCVYTGYEQSQGFWVITLLLTIAKTIFVLIKVFAFGFILAKHHY